MHLLLRRVTGYVTQEDILRETLTVRETLMFQAELRLDPSGDWLLRYILLCLLKSCYWQIFTKAMKIERVETVMKQLGISHRADMRIGNEMKRGLSGGEKVF